jgi:hypothetical protein
VINPENDPGEIRKVEKKVHRSQCFEQTNPHLHQGMVIAAASDWHITIGRRLK